MESVISLLKAVYLRLIEDRCWRVASALSFTTLIALVPLVTVMVSMLSLFPVFETWTSSFEDFLYRNMVPASGDTVREYINRFVNQAGKLTAVGLVILMVSAMFLFATIEDSFNEIWRIKSGRRVVHRLMVYWTVITLGPLLIVASLSVTSYIFSLPVFSESSTVFGVSNTLISLLPFVFEFLAYLLLFMVIPNGRVWLRYAVVGALVATILFEIAKRGFVRYLLNFNSYEVIYGALAAVPIFLIWIYLSWLVVLVGAHIAAVLQDRDDSP